MEERKGGLEVDFAVLLFACLGCGVLSAVLRDVVLVNECLCCDWVVPEKNEWIG